MNQNANLNMEAELFFKTSEQMFRPTRCNKSGILHPQLPAVPVYVLALVCVNLRLLFF